MKGLQKTLINKLRTYFKEEFSKELFSSVFLKQTNKYSIYIRRSGINNSIYKYNISFTKNYTKNMISNKEFNDKSLKQTLTILDSIIEECKSLEKEM